MINGLMVICVDHLTYKHECQQIINVLLEPESGYHNSKILTYTWRNNNVFITSKRRRRRHLDVMKTLLLRRVPAGIDDTSGN